METANKNGGQNTTTDFAASRVAENYDLLARVLSFSDGESLGGHRLVSRKWDGIASEEGRCRVLDLLREEHHVLDLLREGIGGNGGLDTYCRKYFKNGRYSEGEGTTLIKKHIKGFVTRDSFLKLMDTTFITEKNEEWRRPYKLCVREPTEFLSRKERMARLSSPQIRSRLVNLSESPTATDDARAWALLGLYLAGEDVEERWRALLREPSVPTPGVPDKARQVIITYACMDIIANALGYFRNRETVFIRIVQDAELSLNYGPCYTDPRWYLEAIHTVFDKDLVDTEDITNLSNIIEELEDAGIPVFNEDGTDWTSKAKEILEDAGIPPLFNEDEIHWASKAIEALEDAGIPVLSSSIGQHGGGSFEIISIGDGPFESVSVCDFGPFICSNTWGSTSGGDFRHNDVLVNAGFHNISVKNNFLIPDLPAHNFATTQSLSVQGHLFDWSD